MPVAKTPRGKNTVQLQLENRSTLLKLLRQNSHVCRKDLAEISGLTGATVTNLTRDLIAVGLISEDKDYNGPMNRNAVSLKINYDRFLVMVVSLRRGRISYAVSNLNGEVLEQYHTQFEMGEEVGKTLTVLSDTIVRFLEAPAYQGRFVGIGLSVPGPINLEKGEISYLSYMPGWKAIPVKKYLEERFNLPVIMDDLANAAALAEKWFGCGRNYHNLISILVSKGIGAGIIINDRICHGSLGFAGQIGHVSIDFDGPLCDCGNHGCLETYCSTFALVKKARTMLGEDMVGGFDEFRERVSNGDKRLTELVIESGRHLGYAIVNLANTVNPELIVLHGDMTAFGAVWIESVRRAALDRLLPDVVSRLEIKLSALSENPVLLGTAAMVCEYIFDNPRLSCFGGHSQAGPEED